MVGRLRLLKLIVLEVCWLLGAIEECWITGKLFATFARRCQEVPGGALRAREHKVYMS